MADLEMDSEFVLISEATGNLQELFTFFQKYFHYTNFGISLGAQSIPSIKIIM